MYDSENSNYWISQLLNSFIMSTLHIWKSMYDNHILFFMNTENINVLDKKIKFTNYKKISREIKQTITKLPDWYILSYNSMIYKTIPTYAMDIDLFPLALYHINSPSPNGKCMIMCHTSYDMTLRGLHVSDPITRTLSKVFANPYYLSYIRTYTSSPENIFLIKDHFTAYYNHVLHALLNDDITNMIFLSSRQVITFVEILYDMRDILLGEMEILDTSKSKTRFKYCKKILNSINEYKLSNFRSVIKKIWPKLEFIVMMKDGYYRIYTECSKIIFGSIPIYSPVYSIPEVTIGYCIDKDLSYYTLDPRQGYFEFIELNNNYNKKISRNSKTLDCIDVRKLEKGKCYNIIVSSSISGTKRYVTDEIVRVVGFYKCSPNLEIIGKNSDLIIITKDDKMEDKRIYFITPRSVEDILINFYNKNDYIIVDYCYHYNNQNDTINIYIELEKHNYENNHNELIQNYTTNKLNDIYNNTVSITSIKVYIVNNGTFQKLYKARYCEFIDPSIVKIPRLVTDDIDKTILDDNILD